MRNYYSIFDLENLRVGLVGSVHVDRISYWRDILLLLSVMMAVGGTVCFIYSYLTEKRVCDNISESELVENPSRRYDPV